MNTESWVMLAFAVFIAVAGFAIPLIIGRNYKGLKQEVGELKAMAEKILSGQGVKSQDLTTQHDRLAGDLTAQHNRLAADLAARTDTVKGAVTVLSVREEERDKRNELLSADLRGISDSVKRLDAFRERMEKTNEENLRLREQLAGQHEENLRLREALERNAPERQAEPDAVQEGDAETPVGLIKSKERDIRAEEKAKGGQRETRSTDKDDLER